MYVTITEDISIEVLEKFNVISDNTSSLKHFFRDRFYGDDLKSLYIGIFCMSPKFEKFFKIRRPNYQTETKTYIHQGVQVERKAMSLTYDLKLDFETYLNALDVKPLLAQDILKSLDTISTVKKIKDFDLSKLRSDFEHFFQQSGWL
jgi:hypothetical protein